jgi:hypothetical protein
MRRGERDALSAVLILRSRPKVGVSKDGRKLGVPALVLRDAILRIAPQDEGFETRA